MVCPKCNTVINDNSMVCPACGAQINANSGYGYNNQYQNQNYTVPVNSYNNNYQYQKNANQPQGKRKMHKGVLSLIIGIYIVLIIAIVVAILLIMRGNSKKNNTHNHTPIPPEIDNSTDVTGNEEDAFEVDEEVTVDEEETNVDNEDATEEEPADEEEPTEEEVIFEPEPPEDRRLIIAINGLNLRSQPTINSDSLEVIPDGTIITVNSEFGDWVSTEYNGKYGWCKAEFLFEPTEYNYEVQYIATVIANDVVIDIPDYQIYDNGVRRNVRTKVNLGDRVCVYTISNGRAFVSFNHIYGWCDEESLRKLN